MFSRFSPALVAFGGSVFLLAGLIGALCWTSDTGLAKRTGDPLIVYCAEAMRVPMDAIAQDYEREYEQKVELRFGASMSILANLSVTKQGDLFLPADDSYIGLAKEKGLVKQGDVFNLASMNAVVIVRPNFPRKIASWDDFLAEGNRIALGNTEATAIGKVTKDHLQTAGLWSALEKRNPSYQGTVNEVLNSVCLGSVDVGIVWDVVAQRRADVTVVKLKELETVQARVQIALTKHATQRDSAIQFVRYIRASDKGVPQLKKLGYSNIEERGPMDKRVELLVHAGAMLRPALEESLIEFEKRENVRITRVYNGCGILISQMKTGEMPDVFFACDTSFMNQVQDQFNPATNVSTNQLVIAVKKGNPKKIHELLDLGKPGLRVGVGHEHKCALGALTEQTFLQTGVMKQVTKNIVVKSPTGDTLVNQLRVGSLDAVVAYRSNVLPFADELEAIPITGIKCATPAQPIAISKSTTHPELSKRLMEFLRAQESRERFEKMGFGWEVKEVESRQK
jgi:molybdate transport system substrate-binding protein